ncbi:MAG: M20/M25/M40 family metallo-hydrolase [Armatimonadota bacterium]
MNPLLETFLALVHCDTPSRREGSASTLCAQYLARLGFTIEHDDAGTKVGGEIGNLFAFLSGTVPAAPALLFSSHLDTVEPTTGLIVRVDGDRIDAESDTILGADDKCGVAPILEAMRTIVESGMPRPDLQIVLTICEEIGLVGASLIDPSRLRARYGFVLDAGPPVGSIVRAAPAQDSIKVRIHGTAAHAGAEPEKGISAIVAAARAIAALPLGRIDEQTTANVGTIHGGTARNIVPAEVDLVCEARSRDNTRLDAQTATMRRIIEDECAGFGARATFDIKRQYPAFRLDDDAPVLAMAAAAAKACGLEPTLEESGGGSDANHFNGFGVPTAVLATGMQRVHTHDEFCLLSDMEKDHRWIVEIVRQAAEAG